MEILSGVRRMKTPLELIVRILANGGRVEEGGDTYALNEQNRLCIVDEVDDDHEAWFAIECDIGSLAAMAERIGFDELWLKCCELTLTKHKNALRRDKKGPECTES